MEQGQAGKRGRLGKYELLERLGEGGMGEVWKARDTQLQRYVAIKLLRAELRDDPDFIASFMREARLVASLRHPNIVQIHDFQLADVQGENVHAYMVMDYIEGGTLARAIRDMTRQGVLWSASEIVDLFTAISLALDYAHRQGMIHRDIKPANILLDQSLKTSHVLGVPILTDFGIARWQGGGSTVTGFAGTPLYISPEQAQSRPVDARSDLYSLGIVLYEVLTGVTPFRGDNPLAVMLQHVEDQPPAPSLINPLVSPALSAVVLQSIAKEPRARFSSATAMTAALAQAFGLPVPTLLDRPREQRDVLTYYNPLQPRVTPIPQSFMPSGSMPADRNFSESHSPFNQPALEIGRTTPVVGEITPIPAANFAAPHQLAAALHTPASRVPHASGTRPRTGLFARKWLLVVSLCCVIVLLLGLGSAVVVPRLLSSSSSVSTPTAGTGAVGQLRFLSNAAAPHGTFNEVQIDLSNVPSPPAGQVYYAWLTQANSEAPTVPHWLLQVNNGAIQDTYTSVPPQTDLFTGSNLLLITGEDARSEPVVPYPSPARHYYYAIIEHTASATPVFSIRSCPTSNINSAANPCR